MKKTIFVAFILLFGFLSRFSAQVTLTVDKVPCTKCDVLVQNWGVFKTDELGVLNLRDVIASKLGVEVDSLPKIKEVTLAVLTSNESLPTVIRIIPWSKTATPYKIDINSVDVDGAEFGSRLLSGELEERATTIFIENSPQKISTRGIIDEYIRYPKTASVLRLLFWDGTNDFEIVEIRSPKYKSPKEGAQRVKFVAPELHRNFNLTSFDVVLENPTIDLYDKIGLKTTYQRDELGRYWYMITVIDSIAEMLYYAGINLQETIPASVKLQSDPVFKSSLEQVDEKTVPLHVSRINLNVDLHYIVEKKVDAPRAVFDNIHKKPTKKYTILGILGGAAIIIVLICYLIFGRGGKSDFV